MIWYLQLVCCFLVQIHSCFFLQIKNFVLNALKFCAEVSCCCRCLHVAEWNVKSIVSVIGIAFFLCVIFYLYLYVRVCIMYLLDVSWFTRLAVSFAVAVDRSLRRRNSNPNTTYHYTSPQRNGWRRHRHGTRRSTGTLRNSLVFSFAGLYKFVFFLQICLKN